MAITEITQARQLRQRITGEGLPTPADVVRWMGALQAQDYAAAKWAVGLRMRACTDDDIEKAFTEGRLLRTHVMRPTWHFVAPEDIRWMQELTSPRVNAILAYQYREFELDAALFKRSNAALVKALRGGRQLTRAELGEALEKAGIGTSGVRLAHIVSRAELDAVVCSGGRRGKLFTYALVEERAPQARSLRREEALAELTRRYFASRGPATLRDLAWWSGLSAAELRAGIASVRSSLVEETIDGQTHWFADSLPAARRGAPAVYLLTNYDEYIVGYAGRSAIFDEAHAKDLDARHNPLFQNTILRDGRIVGTWKRTLRPAHVQVEMRPFVPPGKAETAALKAAASRYAEFLGLKLEIT